MAPFGRLRGAPGEGLGTPTDMTQNDPHDALIILSHMSRGNGFPNNLGRYPESFTGPQTALSSGLSREPRFQTSAQIFTEHQRTTQTPKARNTLVPVQSCIRSIIREFIGLSQSQSTKTHACTTHAHSEGVSAVRAGDSSSNHPCQSSWGITLASRLKCLRFASLRSEMRSSGPVGPVLITIPVACVQGRHSLNSLRLFLSPSRSFY